MKPILRYVGSASTIIVIAAVLPISAFAQPGGPTLRERDDVHLQNACKQAAHILMKERAHPHYSWAVDQIRACDESGGPAVAAAWDDASAEQSELSRLVAVTTTLRDQRALDAVLEVVRDGARPPLVRLAAMQVLANFADSTSWVALTDLENPPRGGIMGGIFDQHIVQGIEPLPPSSPQTIVAALRQLSEIETDIRVRAAAQYVSTALTLRLQSRQ